VSAAFGNHFMPDFLLFVLVFVLFISTISALILFMTKQITKVSSFIVLGAVIILIMGIISGCFFNIDLTVPVIKNISFFTPTYQALNRLMEIVVNEKIVNMMGYILYFLVESQRKIKIMNNGLYH
jgi:ABC-type multidrug transport system permease subunit